MRHGILLTAFAAMALLAVFSASYLGADSIVEEGNITSAMSGSCGTNVSFTLDDNGNLVISGTGPMTSSFGSSSGPWASQRANIKTVTVTSGVTSIGGFSFYGSGSSSYSALTTVSLPDTLTSIGSNAFANCSALSSINLPTGLQSIDSSAFYGCKSLTTVNIPNTVTTLASSAFSGCDGLLSATVPGSVGVINSSLFYSCDNLKSVTIGNGITSIGSSAFYDCNSLESVVIPDSVTSIGSQAFWGTYSMKQLTMPISVNSVNATSDSSASFRGCANLEKVTLTPGSGTGFNYTNSTSKNSYYQRTPWYQSNGTLTEVVLSEGITHIGDYCFRTLNNVHQLTLPSTLESIGQYAFDNWTSLESLTIPDSVTDISNNAFSYATHLSHLDIGRSLTTIGYGVFMDCGVSSVEIPSNITTIGQSAFAYNQLTSLTISDSVTKIESSAFAYSYKLTSAVVPDSVTNLVGLTFANSPLLEKLVLPEGLTVINTTVKNCPALKEINIPDTVTKISNAAFENCTSLTSVILPESLTTIESTCFRGCTGLATVYNASPLTFTIGDTGNGYVAYYATSVVQGSTAKVNYYDGTAKLGTQTGFIANGSSYLTVDYDDPFKSGYSFMGWDYNTPATTARCQDGDVINMDSNPKALYAVWQPKDLTATSTDQFAVARTAICYQIAAELNDEGTITYAVKSCSLGTASVNGYGQVTYTPPVVSSTQEVTIVVTVTGTFDDGDVQTKDVTTRVTVDPVLSFTNASTSGHLTVKGA